MKIATGVALGTGAMLGLLTMAPASAEFVVMSDNDDEEINIVLDREAEDGEITREHLHGHRITIHEDNDDGRVIHMRVVNGNTVSTCYRSEESRAGHTTLLCRSGDGDRHEIRFDSRMGDYERAMAEFEDEMSRWDWGRTALIEAATAMADAAEHIAETVMTSLAESGVRIENDGAGNQTIWVDSHDEDDPAMRVVSSADGNDLVFMYFDGFDRDYHYVIEDNDLGGANGATIYAYDVSTVDIVRDRDDDQGMDSSRDENGAPHLTVRTEHPDHVRVIPLDRSRFDG